MTNKDNFIAEIYPAAVKTSLETGTSKELILAQAAQETGWGRHVLAGTHNIFNIKASADWKGPTKTFYVWEIEDGQKVWKDQEFRVYGSTEEALRDHVQFLQENPRYTKAGLFDEGTKGDFTKEAAALQKAGYATDPLYAAHLIAVYNGPTMQHAIRMAQARADGGILEQGNHGTAVRELQSHLAGLGYAGADGRPLKPDGHFGPDTRGAVEAFQRDHQLVIDCKVGPQTHDALDAARLSHSRQAAPSLADPAHPDHALFDQAQQQVHRIDTAMGRKPDQYSDSLAGVLAVAAKHKGISRIDEVAIDEGGTRAFAAQNHTGYSTYAGVDTATAIKIPLAQSSADALFVHAAAVPSHPSCDSPDQQIRPTTRTLNLLQ